MGDDARQFSLDKGAVSGVFCAVLAPHIGYVMCFSLDGGFFPNSTGQEERVWHKKVLDPNERKHCENAT